MKDWQTLSRNALDDGYANAAHIDGAEAYPARWAAEAATFRATHTPETLSYGDHPRQRIDLFLPKGTPAGLVVFVHGGYWRAFDRTDWSHLAAGALRQGHAVALPGYILAPEARIPQITAMIARAIDATAARIPGPIRLTGHSAGGHLVARMVMPDAAPACRDRIATCVPISPVADLRPLVGQSLNDDLHLDAATARAESPVTGAPIAGPAIATHVGAEERPAFLWQARALTDTWSHPLRVAPTRHHFDVIDALADPDSPLLADLLA